MYYDFKCKECDHEQGAVFPANDYDKKVMENGRLKRVKCEKCKTLSLYRHIITAPAVMGGTKGYISMERWQKMHPEHYKKKEDEAVQAREDRNRKKMMKQINQQIRGEKTEGRHEGYGEGKTEDKLRSPDDKD